MRKYESVWQTLKKHKTVTLKAAPEFHKRIIKAVFKEKDLDKASRDKFRLETESTGVLICLKLRAKINLYNL